MTIQHDDKNRDGHDKDDDQDQGSSAGAAPAPNTSNQQSRNSSNNSNLQQLKNYFNQNSSNPTKRLPLKAFSIAWILNFSLLHFSQLSSDPLSREHPLLVSNSINSLKLDLAETHPCIKQLLKPVSTTQLTGRPKPHSHF